LPGSISQSTLRSQQNRAKSVIRVRSESGHRTSFVGHPDGDNAGDERRDEIDGAMPPKPFRSLFIAVLRSFLGVSRRYAGLQLTSSNRGYPCSRRSLTECMDKMTVPSWRERKSRPLWMNSRGASPPKEEMHYRRCLSYLTPAIARTPNWAFLRFIRFVRNNLCKDPKKGAGCGVGPTPESDG
jgi:hypothetical protein